jgi:hypothetical protein
VPLTERVVPSLAGIRREPDSPGAVLIVTDDRRAALALSPHPDDTGDNCVVLPWAGPQQATTGAPNDEALAAHRLHQRGLAALRRAGVVGHSERIACFEHLNRVHPQHDVERFSRLRHYILPLKESTVEVIAETVTVQQPPGPPLHAASLTLRST